MVNAVKAQNQTEQEGAPPNADPGGRRIYIQYMYYVYIYIYIAYYIVLYFVTFSLMIGYHIKSHCIICAESLAYLGPCVFEVFRYSCISYSINADQVPRKTCRQ